MCLPQQAWAWEDFTKFGVTIYGVGARHLVKVGCARNFREIGTGTRHYTSAGYPVPTS